MSDAREAADTLAKVLDYFDQLYRPGRNRFHAIIHAVENPVTGIIALSGPVYDGEGGFPVTHLGLLHPDGRLRMLSRDKDNDSDPIWSPDGATLAFLSDRGRGSGNFQLVLADGADPDERRPGPVLEDEAVESFAWSSDGGRILIQSADSGADAAGSASTARIGSRAAGKPSWLPTVETGSHDHSWRRARVWDLAADRLVPIGGAGQNVWEADWCGPDEVVAIISASPTEGGWYQTELGIAPATGGTFACFASCDVELAGLRGSPDGRHVAVIEGRFHRTVALGTLAIYERESGRRHCPDIGAEVSALAWRDTDRLFFAGFQSPTTVAGTHDLANGTTRISWRTSGTAGRKVPYATPVGSDGFVAPLHASDLYPRLVRVDDIGKEQVLLDLATDETRALVAAIGSAEAIAWRGGDGLEIHGFVVKPAGVARPPLVTFIHGGPSHLFRDSWTFDNPLAGLLVKAGYAVLFPNPRGSSGRGLDFASRVIGDWGGEDSRDILAGIDHVIAHHEVDNSRLYLTGRSYGGYMTSWLVTQTDRFNAACAVAPLVDMRSFSFTAHHPEFLALSTGGDPYEIGGMFDERSPLRHAGQVSTPTMLIAGGQDKTTPPTEAVQFHHALVQRDIPSELAIYPEEGHSIERLEAQIDHGVRVLDWFRKWEGRNGSDDRA